MTAVVTHCTHVSNRRRPPYLDLGLCHAERERQLRPLRARQVLGLLERLLQREDLLAAERGPRVLLGLGVEG